MATFGEFALTPFFVANPVVFPAKTIENLFEKLTTVNVHHGAFARDKTGDLASAIGGEVVGGLVSLATGAVTGNNEPRIGDGADEGYAFVDGLCASFVWVEGEVEFIAEVAFDDADVTHELMFLGYGDNNEKVVNVAAIVLVAKVLSNETVELIEKDVGDELTSEVADDDAMPGLAIEKTFVGGKSGPFFFGATDNDVAHGVIINDLSPKKLDGLVELVSIIRAAGDAIFREIIGR